MAELMNPAAADMPRSHVLPAFTAAFIERIRPTGERLPGSFQIGVAGFEKLMWF
ncbi:MAG: hypothetical protein BroJett011_40560 [Chloroflexota bacterium]|nr:MAG: hypothetical protein BroJett011_40560 [Chloroflexota bacterium]